MSWKNTKGEGNVTAKLTARQVRDIKLMHYYGASNQIIAKHFKISRAQTSRIVNNKDWRHV